MQFICKFYYIIIFLIRKYVANTQTQSEYVTNTSFQRKYVTNILSSIITGIWYKTFQYFILKNIERNKNVKWLRLRLYFLSSEG